MNDRRIEIKHYQTWLGQTNRILGDEMIDAGKGSHTDMTRESWMCALRTFTLAAIELDAHWMNLDDQDRPCDGYPFEVSFDEMAIRIKRWYIRQSEPAAPRERE